MNEVVVAWIILVREMDRGRVYRETEMKGERDNSQTKGRGWNERGMMTESNGWNEGKVPLHAPAPSL